MTFHIRSVKMKAVFNVSQVKTRLVSHAGRWPELFEEKGAASRHCFTDDPGREMLPLFRQGSLTAVQRGARPQQGSVRRPSWHPQAGNKAFFSAGIPLMCKSCQKNGKLRNYAPMMSRSCYTDPAVRRAPRRTLPNVFCGRRSSRRSKF